MFYDNYVQLCEQKGVKPSRAAEDSGVPRSAVTNWKNKWNDGVEVFPTNANAVKLAAYFGISVDSLLSGNTESPQPQAGGENDIDVIVNDILNNLLNNQGDTLMLDGNPTSPKALEYLRESIRANVEHAKRLNEEERKKG